jgi:hypothetical protein
VGATGKAKDLRLPRAVTYPYPLEPCVPDPQDTEIIANIVTSPHHLSATMVTGRIHRMTEIEGSHVGFTRRDVSFGQQLECARAFRLRRPHG